MTKRFVSLIALSSLSWLLPYGVAADDEVVTAIHRDVRIVQDIKRLSQDFLEAGLEEFVPANVTVVSVKDYPGVYYDTNQKKFINQPGKPRGVYAAGTIDLLDLKNSASVVRTLSYNVRLQLQAEFPHEEARPYSPFLRGGFVLLKGKGKESTNPITEFPGAYMIPSHWNSFVACLVEEGFSGKVAKMTLSNLGQDTNPFEVVLLANRTLRENKGDDQLSGLLKTNDLFGRAAVIMMFLQSRPQAVVNAKDVLNDSSNAEEKYALAIALLAGMRTLDAKDVQPLVKSLKDLSPSDFGSPEVGAEILKLIGQIKH